MGHIKFIVLYNGRPKSDFDQTIQEYSAIRSVTYDKYNFDLIEQIEFEGEDQEITIDVCNENIDWTQYNLPDHVIQAINSIIYYREVYGKISKVHRMIGYTNVNDDYKLDGLAFDAIQILENFQLSDYLNPGMIAGHRSETIRALRHTQNQEVRMIGIAKSKKNRESYFNDAKKHLLSDMHFFIHWMREVELNTIEVPPSSENKST